MWRLNLRFEVTGDPGAVWRTEIRDRLAQAGIKRGPSGGWEGDCLEPAAVAGELAEIFERMAHPELIAQCDPQCQVEFLWFCLDRVPLATTTNARGGSRTPTSEDTGS